jgi:hypothetical protein
MHSIMQATYSSIVGLRVSPRILFAMLHVLHFANVLYFEVYTIFRL